MAVVYPLASPAQFGVAALTWGGSTNTARAKAPWTFQDLVQVFAGAMWVGTLSVTPHKAAEGRGLAAWLTSLEGRRGTFLLGDPAATEPKGSAAAAPGTPVVDGGGQAGKALAVRGLPASASGYLLAGDYVQLGTGIASRLHMVLEDADADAGGKSVLTIWPALRAAPQDGAAVVVSGAEGLFALTTPTNTWSVRPALIYDGVTLAVQEVVP